MTRRLDAYLSATQLGITLTSLGLGWLGEPFLAQMIEPFFALAKISSPVLIETVAFTLAFGTITTLHDENAIWYLLRRLEARPPLGSASERSALQQTVSRVSAKGLKGWSNQCLSSVR